VRNGLVEDSHALLFPTEITLEFHPVELNVEVGRSFVSHGLDGLGLWTRHRGDHHAAGRDVSRPRV
jgi:hypothetical protein